MHQPGYTKDIICTFGEEKPFLAFPFTRDKMQRTTGGFYSAVSNRPETYLTLAPADSTTSSGSLSQLQWKKKVLNKTGANKRRQNPARQAAVRSFKKYQFSNQDFLLRKYLRSVKKELRPKRCDTTAESTCSVVNVSGSCRMPRQPVDKSCVRRVSGVAELRCKISNNSNAVVSSMSSMNNKKGVINQENEGPSKINMYEEFNLQEAIKSCELKKWPQRQLERPTFENIEIDDYKLSIDDELVNIMNESGAHLANYCKSLRDLSILNFNEYICPSDDSISPKEVVNHVDNRKKISEIGNRVCHSDKSDMIVGDINNDLAVAYNNDRRDKQISGRGSLNDRDNNLCLSTNIDFGKLTDRNKSSEEDEDDDMDEDDDEDDNDDEDDEDDDDDEEEQEEDDDEEEEDDDSEEDNHNNNEQDFDNSDDEHNKVTVCDKRLVGTQNNESTICPNEENKKRNPAQNVVSIDTSDSSSVSSSPDDTSHTETCSGSDNQTINSDNQELCDDKNKNKNALIPYSETKIDKKRNLTNDPQNSPQCIKIKNDNSTSDSGKNSECFRKSQSNNLPEDTVKSSLHLKPSVVNTNERKSVVRSSTSDQKIQSNSTCCGQKPQGYIKIRNRDYPISVLENNPTLKNYLKEQTPQRYIKIRNRDYPISVLENNPTLINYLKETHPNTLISGIDNKDIQPTLVNQTENRKSMKKELSEKKIKSVNTLSHGLNLRANKLQKQLVHVSSEQMNSNVQNNETDILIKKVQRVNNFGGIDNKKNELFSPVCSLEDGLAFLDKQNEIPATVNTQHLSLSSSDQSETITLYNQSTSCTLPYPATTSKEALKKSQGKKLTAYHQNMSPDQTVPQNNVASQVDFSSVKGSQTFIPYDTNQFQCSHCKFANAKLKESLKTSIEHLNDIVTGSIVLNSFLMGKTITESTSKFFSELNNL